MEATYNQTREMETDDFTTKCEEAHRRCREDRSLDLLEELRSASDTKWWHSFLDECRERREHLSAEFKAQVLQPIQVTGTQEALDAIKSYHNEVVLPHLAKLLTFILRLETELALIKVGAVKDRGGTGATDHLIREE